MIRLRKLPVSVFSVGVMMVSAASAMAQTATPVPPHSVTGIVASSTAVFSGAGVAVIVFATAIISLGTMLYRKFRGASR